MKLRADDKLWISQEIAGQVQQIVDALTPRGWRKLVKLLREIGPIIGTASFIIALLGLTGAGWYYAFSRVDKQARFEEKTSGRLDSVEKRLGGIENNLKILPAQIVASKLTPLPPKELKQHKQELLQVKNNLSTVPADTPTLWPAAFQIITLTSQATADVERAESRPKETVVDNVRNFGVPCAAISIVNEKVVLKNVVQGVLFKNAVVRFDPSVRLINDVFINCVFIFPAEQTPTKLLQEIGQTLLASDLSYVTLNAS